MVSWDETREGPADGPGALDGEPVLLPSFTFDRLPELTIVRRQRTCRDTRNDRD